MQRTRNGPGRGRLGTLVSFAAAATVMVYLSYALPSMLPGDFVTAMYAGSNVTLTAEQEVELRSHYSGDEGFAAYLGRLFTLDWGYSYAFMTPVAGLFFEALPWTLLLLGTAHLLSMTVAFVAGVETAWRSGGRAEKGLVGGMTFLEGVPEISTGVLLLYVFGLQLNWFPVAGAETAYADVAALPRAINILHHLALPLATLSLAYLPGNFLLTRNSMIMVLRASYVDTARAKGLPPRRVRYAHAARNALLPLVTRFGLRLAFMITGALVIERIYSYPGLGTLLFNAIQARDLPVIRAVVLASSILVLAVILLLEACYRFLDPRLADAR